MKKNKQVGKNVAGDMIQNSCIINISNNIYNDDEITNCLKTGDVHGAIEIINRKEKSELGRHHALFPHYLTAVKRVGNDLVPYSKPSSKEASKEYPQKLEAKISFSDKYKGFNSVHDLLDYSYKTQTELEIKDLELIKMLGDVVDPYQDDIEHLLSSTTDWKLKPRDFPEAKPYKVVIEGTKVSYDYVLLRLTRIVDDTVICLSNREQAIEVVFNFYFDLNSKKMSMNVLYNQDTEISNISVLKYLKFVKGIQSKKVLSITNLESDTVLAKGIIDNFNCDSVIGDIDSEIMFIEYITLIEGHYNETIKIPDEISKDDLETVYFLGNALKSGERKGTWENLDIELIKVEETAESLMSYEERPCSLAYVGSARVIIFEKEYGIPKVTRIFENAKIVNLKKVKQQVDNLAEGEGFNMSFVAAGDNQYIEEYDFDI